MQSRCDRETIAQCCKLSLPLPRAFVREPLENRQLHPDIGLI